MYYSTCLTPNQQTETQSYNQITGEYNTPQLLAIKFQNIIPWLMGQKLLQDDLCLWMELKLSPLSAASTSELKPLWLLKTKFAGFRDEDSALSNNSESLAITVLIHWWRRH